MAWKKGSAAPAKRSEYATFIDEGSSIEGKFSFTGAVMLNGRLHGEIVSNDTLIVGEKGVVNASIRAGFVQIYGEVVGNVYASERAELCANSRVYGDVDAPVVIIEDGAIFEGHCRMTKTRPAEVSGLSSRDASVVPLKRTEPPR
jgi:cytoskeletal protein CcmA (bactofilin family)